MGEEERLNIKIYLQLKHVYKIGTEAVEDAYFTPNNHWKLVSPEEY
jgi:hypothetical protein